MTMQSTMNAFSGLTTFSVDELLLCRASPLYDVLHNCAVVLNNNEGSAATYELSKRVDSIDDFLSHNWSTSRQKKFGALVWHYNFPSASVVAFLVAVSSFVLQVSGVLPLPIDVDNREVGVDQIGMFAHLLTMPVFMLTLFFKHDILPVVCKVLGWVDSPNIFLDKTCIHQTDVVLQEQGITKLGAFLHNSKRMLILYSDVYLRKLWTVYEVACFSATRDDYCMKVLHVDICNRAIGLMIVFYFAFSIQWIPGSRGAVWVVAIFASYFCLSYLARRSMQELASAWQQLHIFDVRSAICLDENDRPILETLTLTSQSDCEDPNGGPRRSLH